MYEFLSVASGSFTTNGWLLPYNVISLIAPDFVYFVFKSRISTTLDVTASDLIASSSLSTFELDANPPNSPNVAAIFPNCPPEDCSFINKEAERRYLGSSLTKEKTFSPTIITKEITNKAQCFKHCENKSDKVSAMLFLLFTFV